MLLYPPLNFGALPYWRHEMLQMHQQHCTFSALPCHGMQTCCTHMLTVATSSECCTWSHMPAWRAAHTAANLTHSAAHAGMLRSHACKVKPQLSTLAHGRTCRHAALTCWAWGSPACRASAGVPAECTGVLCAPQTSWPPRTLR